MNSMRNAYFLFYLLYILCYNLAWRKRRFNMEDTIAAVATTIGESSINVIRISGKDSISVANKIFSKDISNVQSHTVHYGFIMEDK